MLRIQSRFKKTNAKIIRKRIKEISGNIILKEDLEYLTLTGYVEIKRDREMPRKTCQTQVYVNVGRNSIYVGTQKDISY